jgi:ADP-heptose:LPS heptosyltransferase
LHRVKADRAVSASSNAIPGIKRILIIKLADHGDAILATSAIAALRVTYPNATIDVLTTSNGAIAFELCPVIDHILVIDKHAFDSPRGMLHPAKSLRLMNLVRRLRRSRYDAVVLLQHLTTNFGALKYRWLCRGIGAPIRAGLDNGQGDFLTHRAVDYGFGVKSVHDYNLDVVAQLGANIEQPRPSISVPDDARRAAR